jgi:hypothetical protein
VTSRPVPMTSVMGASVAVRRFMSRGSTFRLLTALVIGILLVARRPESFFMPQFWAEDANLYYYGALTEGLARTLFFPYSGYFQVVPHLAAAASAHVPAFYAPAVLSTISYGIDIWACSLFVDSRFGKIVASRELRFLVCCAVAVIPPATELTGSITNSHWYMSFGAFLLLIGEPRTGRRSELGNVATAFGMLLTSLSGAETLLLAPLAVWRALVLKDAFARAAPLAFLVGVAVQFVSLKLAVGRDAPVAQATLDATIFATSDAFLHRIVLTAVGGEGASQFVSARDLEGFVLLLGVFMTILAVIVFERLPQVRIPLVLLTTLCLASLAAALNVRAMGAYYPAFRVTYYGGERYFVLPLAYFVLAVAIILGNIGRLGPRAKCVCFLAFFGCGFIFDLRESDLPDRHWAAYAPSIDRWIAAQRRGQPSPPLDVPMNPIGNLSLPALK